MPEYEYKLDGRPLDDDVEYITVKVKVPIEDAKIIASGIVGYGVARANAANQLVDTIKSRLTATKVEPTKIYVSGDIKVNMVYRFTGGNRNTYRVVAVNHVGDVVAQRLSSSSAGPAGDFIFSNTAKICHYLNYGRATLVGHYL